MQFSYFVLIHERADQQFMSSTPNEPTNLFVERARFATKDAAQKRIDAEVNQDVGVEIMCVMDDPLTDEEITLLRATASEMASNNDLFYCRSDKIEMSDLSKEHQVMRSLVEKLLKED